MKQLIRKLAVLVMLAVCLVAPQSMNAKTVYFDAGSHSGNVYVYIVDGDNASDGWNNTANCKLCTKVFDNVWAYDVANATKVIFTWNEYSTDNNKLTKDCTVQDGYIYKNDKVDQSGEEYIVGLLGDGLADANGWSINDNDLVKLKPSSNFYEFEGTLKTKSGSGNKNFRIYNKYRGKEYEPSAYLQVLPENTVSFSNTGANQCWWINEGEYTIKVNLKDNKFVVSKKYKNVYLRGDEFGGWGDNTPFATTDYITYTITKDFAAGKEFKIYDENSKSYYRISDTNPSNGTFDGDGTTSGNMKFDTDQKNVTITFNKDTKKITFSGIASSTVEYTYWLRFNNDKAIDVEIFENTPLGLTSLGGNTFTVVVKDKATKEQKYVYGKNVTINGSATVSPLTLNGGQITIPEREGNYTFTLALGANKMPTSISVDVPEEGGNQPVVDDLGWYLIGHVNNTTDWTTGKDGKKFTKQEDGTYTLTNVNFPNAKDNNSVYLHLYQDKAGKDYGPTSTNTPIVIGTVGNAANYNKSNNWMVPAPGTYDFTISADGKKVYVKKSESAVPSTGLYMYGYTEGGVYGRLLTFSENAGVASATATLAPSDNERKIYYVIYKDGKRYGSSSGNKEHKLNKDYNYTNAVKVDESSSTANDYYVVTIPANMIAEFSYQTGFGFNGNVNDFTGSGTAVWVSGMNDASSAGKVYLLGNLLNDCYESPAWEMHEQADGTFFIDKFAMRKCSTIKLAVYDQAGKRSEVTPTVSGNPGYNNDYQPGWYYKATYNRTANTLSFEPMSGGEYNNTKDVLPYVGILGEKFTQNTPDGNGYKTRHTDDKAKKTLGNTNYGWQEAYIEYDENGHPIFDKNGNAYYNTVWPPRNNILMKSDIGNGVDPLNVSTKDLTMVLDSRGLMTGSEWKKELNSGDYKNLELVGETKYYRYVADDMWMLGNFKFWTGWAGHKQPKWNDTDKRNYDQAEWENHWYWGPVDGCQTDVTINTYTTIEAQKDGNYQTKDYARQYYKTLELFIPITNDGQWLDRSNVRIYLTEAVGGAVIDSYLETKKGDKFHHVGFNPTLDVNPEKFPSGYHVSSYTITRHRYVPNEENPEKYPYVDVNNVEVSADKAIVTNGQKKGLNWTNADSFNNSFTKDFNANFVDDGLYGSGLYIYNMVVEFDGPDGKKTANVWSPWVQVLDDDFKVKADVYQLVELPENAAENYNYVTYSNSHEPQLVNIDEYGNVTAIDAYSGDDIAKVYGETGKWTNMSLFVTEEPTLFAQTQGVSKTIESFTIENGDNIAVDFLANEKVNNKYVGVADNTTTLETIPFKAKFSGNIVTASANGESQNNPAVADATVTYTPTFPLPYFGDAVVNVAYELETEGDERGKEVLDVFTATHDLLDNANSPETAAAEISANVPVVMPNIIADIKADVYRKLDMAINDNTVKANADATTYGLNYRYQSPYNWVEQNADNKWVAKENSWTMAASYAEGINPYVASNAKNSVSASVTPEFNVPTCGERKYSFGMEYNTENEEWYNRLYVKKYTASGTDILGGEKLFQNENALHMVHIIGDNDDENKYISDLMSHETGNNPDRTHLIAEQHINKTKMTLALDAYHRGDASEMIRLMNDGKAWATGKTIEFGYAHFFKANELGDSQSAYVGFTGEFPFLRYDLVPGAAQNAPMRENGKNWTETLDTNDNAFILVPYLTQATVAADDIATGIDDVFGEDTLSVVAGKGFIDMMGNEGRIYATDGRQVYIGAERAELPQGVYMVVLATKTVKVMVK